ncbi:MAG: serine hydrolase domain-containing protein, partial [Blastocatellia bacterium]
MKRNVFKSLLLAVLLSAVALPQQTYVPPDGNWEHRTPEQAKLDPVKLKEAVDFAIASESKAPRNLELAHYQTFGREPYGEPVGQFKDRGAATGIVVRNGYIVAEWGEP